MEKQALEQVVIRAAQWPCDEPVARALLERYFQSLRDNSHVAAEIRAKDRAPELAALQEWYGDGANAALLLAFAGKQACGCVAVSLLRSRDGAAELKRLYVSPEARGQGTGRTLVLRAAQWARAQGAHELLLDTLPSAMPEAVRLYRQLGFVPTERYNDNEGCCFAFFRLGLE